MKKKKILKRVLSLLLAVAMVAGTVHVMGLNDVTVVEAAGENLITNGGFDSVSDWTYIAADDSTGDVPAQEQEAVMETIYAYKDGFDDGADSYVYVSGTGSHAATTLDENKVLKVTNSTANNEWYTFSTTSSGIEVESGKTYTFSFRAKAEGNCCFVLFVQSWSAGGVYANSGNQVINAATSNGWTEVSYQYTVPEDHVYVQLRIQERWRTEYYIDDVTVTSGEQQEVVVTTENKAYEDGFDSGADSYVYVSGTGSHEEATVDENNVLKVTNSTANNTWYTFSTTSSGIAVEPGKTYTFSFRAKAEGNCCFVLLVQSWTSGGVYANSGNQVINAATSNGWTEVSYQYTVPEDHVYVQLRIQERWRTEYYIDDIKVSFSETVAATNYTQGIGTCITSGVAAEEDNVLYVEDYKAVSTAVDIKAGSRYQYSFQMKHSATESDFDFDVHAGGVKAADVVSGELSASGDYETISGTFTATSDATTFGFLRSGVGEVYIDDVTLVEIPGDHTSSLEENYIPDGAEVMIDDDFTSSPAGVLFGMGTEDSDYAYEDGMAVAHFNAHNTYFRMREYEFTKGHTYVLSFYIWIQNANNFQLDMVQNGNSDMGPIGLLPSETAAHRNYLMHYNSSYEQYSLTVNGLEVTDSMRTDTSGWEKVVLTWTAKETGKEWLYLRNFGSGSADVYLDDIALYDNTKAVAQEQLLTNYYDLAGGSEGYLVTSAEGETVTITDADENTTTVADGEYTTITKAGEYTITRGDHTSDIVLYNRGDANAESDGKVTAKDLVATKKKIAGIVIDSASTKAADINSDGVLDTKDDAFLRQAIVNEVDIISTQKGLSGLGQGVMPIVGCNGPSNVDNFAEISATGINYIVVNATDISEDAALAQEILAAAEDNDIKVFLNNDNAVNPDGGSAVENASDLAAYNSTYDSYHSFAGYYVSDGVYFLRQYTSNTGKYYAGNGIAEYAGVLGTAEDYVNVHTFFNLLPFNSQALGYSISGNEESVSVSYEDYKAYALGACAAGTSFLANDMTLEAGAEDFYQNLAWMRSIGQDEEIQKPFYGAVQVEEANVTQMYLEANAALAFGAKGIQYDHVENADAGALAINRFIKSVDYVLMHATNKGVIVTDADIKGYVDRGVVEKYGALKTVSGDDALVGCFDYYDKDAYLVVNTNTSASTDATLTFDEAVEAYAIAFDTTETTISANSYTVSLAAGESVLVVLDTRNTEEEEQQTGTEESVDSNMQPTVVQANQMANAVQGYYTNANKNAYVVENDSMKLTHGLAVGSSCMTSLTNTNGDAYLTSTGNNLDVVITVSGTSAYTNASTSEIWANTTQMGYYYYETRLQGFNFGSSISNMYLEKVYHTYADKMYQEFRVIATDDTTESNVTQLGFRAYVPKSSIGSGGMSYSQDGETVYTSVDSGSNTNLQYVGFDIQGVGVIGFIVAGQTGVNLQVTQDSNGYYVSQFVKSPSAFTDFAADEIANWEANSMTAPTGYITFGNRVYTDDTHTFDGLVKANAEEQNPLDESNISVDTTVSGAEFVGYNHLTGNYQFNLDGSSYTSAYNNKTNQNYFEHINIENVEEDRVIYLDVHNETAGGGTEGAALVDSTGVQIPIPMQVSKNFNGENVKEIFNNDSLYGETYMPLCIEAGESYDFTVINAYWNWGDEFPIKQLSSIEFFTSYYHMSTGTVETTCIAPYYAAKNNEGFFEGISYFLPDFRGMSTGELSGDAVQHNSVGVVYGPSNGSSLGTYTDSQIHSTGLTYSDMDYSYISDDGAFKYTMRHVEMPQEDESRTYYTIDFEILKDTTLTQEDFEIIAFDGKYGNYRMAQYVDTNGTVTDLDLWYEYNIAGYDLGRIQNTGYYNLHKGSSYFALYDLRLIDEAYSETGNVGLVVKDHSDNISLAFAHQKHTQNDWLKEEINYGYLTLASDTAFSAGDTFSVDLILLPFGEVAQQNCDSVVEVYNDSAVNPLTTTATTGTVVEDTWVPTIKAEENVAEFTLSGGVNTNRAGDSVTYAVKVTDFTSLAIPHVEQYVDGSWVDYEYASDLGYDGYSVEYAEDGTYSYSFAFAQTAAGNRFRVSMIEDVIINYYVEGNNVKTVRGKQGKTLTTPDELALGIFGRQIEGFYKDPAFVQEYDFATALTEDMNLYVKLSRELYIDAEMFSTMTPTNVGSSEITSDGYCITGPGTVNMLLRKSGLNLNVGEEQTLKLVVNAGSMDHIQLKLGGTYLLADGTEVEATIPTDAAGAVSYQATSYIKWPTNDSLVTLEFDLSSTTLGGVEVDKFLEITEIAISTNPKSGVETHSLTLGSLTQTYAASHTVSYVLDSTELTTQTVNHDKQIGEVPTATIETHSSVKGYEVVGYYMDAACTIPYDFGNWIITDTTVYVKKGDTFYVSPNALTTFSHNSGSPSTGTVVDGVYHFVGTAGSNDNYIYTGFGSGIDITNTQTIEIKAKGISNFKSFQIFPVDGVHNTVYSGTYCMTLTAGETDENGYTTYTADISSFEFEKFTYFRLDIDATDNSAERIVDIMYIKAVN